MLTSPPPPSLSANLLVAAALLLPACNGDIIVGWDERVEGAPDASIDTSEPLDSTVPDGPHEAADAKRCEDVGGVCLPSTGACDGGAWADPATHACDGVGLQCCLGGEPPPDADMGGCEDAGGTCSSVGPTSCTTGHWASPSEYSCHDWVGVLCCLPGPGPLTDGGLDEVCGAIGGNCVSLGPMVCQSSLWDAPIPFLCGSALDMGCCFPL